MHIYRPVSTYRNGLTASFLIFFALMFTLTSHGWCSSKDKTQAQKAGTESKASEKIAAVVNGTEITETMLDEAVKVLRQRLQAASQDGTDTPYIKALRSGDISEEDTNATFSMPDKDIRHKALQRLIDVELAVQEAKKLEIKPPAGIIRAVTSKLNFNMEGAGLHPGPKVQKAPGPDLRKRIIRDYLYKQVCITKIIPAIKIDPEEIRDIYEKHKARFIIPEKIVITDLHFLHTKNEKKLRKEAEKVLEKLLSTPDRDFKKLSPDGSYLVRTIQIDEDKEPDIYFAAWDMEPGEVSNIITAHDGLHIIKVNEKNPERTMTFQEAKPIIERELITRKYRQEYEKYFRGLRKRAEITITPDPQEDVSEPGLK